MSDYELLRSLMTYDPETGSFKWLKSGKGRNKDLLAGYVAGNHYRYIRLNGKTVKASRAAWLYVHGSWPDGDVDHIDHNTINDSINNLRVCTHAENMQNRIRPASHNKSGYLGVSFCKSTGRWRATVNVDGKSKQMEPQTAINI